MYGHVTWPLSLRLNVTTSKRDVSTLRRYYATALKSSAKRVGILISIVYIKYKENM